MSTLYSGNITIITTNPKKFEKSSIEELFTYETDVLFPIDKDDLLQFVKTMQYPVNDNIITSKNTFFVKVKDNQELKEQFYKQILKELKQAKKKINESIRYFQNNKEKAEEFIWTYKWPYRTGTKLAAIQPYVICYIEEPVIKTLPEAYQMFIWNPDLLQKDLYLSYITWYSDDMKIY